MTLPSHQLDAFLAVAQTRNFSRAAGRLRVTQSALSQRVGLLEREVGHKLFVRGGGRAGMTLTEAGARLLRYCQAREALEADLLADLGSSDAAGLAGSVRIAGFSSVMRSVVVPALAPLCRSHPGLLLELVVREMDDLAPMLARASADLVLTDRPAARPETESVHLGDEHWVLVESAVHRERDAVYLDHAPDDPTTALFFRKHGASSANGASGALARAFFDDIYGVLDGVAHGFGRAVVSSHMVPPGAGVRRVTGYAPVRSPVYLHRARQPAYSRAQQAVYDALRTGAGPRLAATPSAPKPPPGGRAAGSRRDRAAAAPRETARGPRERSPGTPAR